jgi:NAD(P)-dependent dehydrogenase (short-subunit alcohol dehydrogenase family)
MDLSTAFSLQGKVAIVTGASRGIGTSIAECFAAAGAKVVISSRKQEELEKVAEKLKKKGYEVTGISCDIKNTEELNHLVKKTIEIYDQLDVLVNNAGSNPIYGKIQDLDLEIFDHIMAVNVKAPYELSKLCLPFLRQSNNPSIINIGSTDGISPEVKLGLYSVSKAALISLTKVFAKEWGQYGIRVNVICPGLTKTKFSKFVKVSEKCMMDMVKKLPIKRMGESKEIGAMALFLASSASSYTTGTIMSVDGGFAI